MYEVAVTGQQAVSQAAIILQARRPLKSALWFPVSTMPKDSENGRA